MCGKKGGYLELQQLDKVKLYKVTLYEATATEYGRKLYMVILELWYVYIHFNFLFSLTNQTFTNKLDHSCGQLICLFLNV